jgi:hypothetical protein
MADFQTKVQAVTQLTMGTDPAPSTAELTEFLKEGVLDVINRSIAVRSTDAVNFTAVTAEYTANGQDLSIGKIISVVRENGTNDQWRKCIQVDPSSQYDVTNPDSLDYATKEYPAYAVDGDNTINVYPAADTGGADSFKVYYVSNVPESEGGSSLAYNSDNIKNFPLGKVHLVVLYASMKSLEAAANNSITLDEDAELAALYTQQAQILKGEYMSHFGVTAQSEAAKK